MDWKDFSDADLVVFAVYLLGGEKQFVEVEDIAVKAAGFGSGKFAWQRHPEQIDMDLVKKSLAADSRNGHFLTGSTKSGWMLTEHGKKFVEQHQSGLPDPVQGAYRLSDEEKRFHPWYRKRIKAHPAFKKVAQGHSDEVTRDETEKIFLIDKKMNAKEKARRLEFFTRSFEYDPVVGPVVSFLAAKAMGK